MSSALEQRVKEFVAMERATAVGTITLDTTLLGDLGVDGADGWELIEAFGKEFEVDLSEFDASKHFGPEAGAFPPLFFIQLFREFILKQDPHSIAGVSPITVQDLVDAAEKKRWLLL
jgi:acyl carrier protein